MILPINISFTDWTRNLLIDFPTDNIPIYHEGDDWKRWGDMVASQTNFSNNAAPSTINYSDNMQWAMDVYKQMQNFS